MKIKTYKELDGEIVFEINYDISYPIISFLISNNIIDASTLENTNNILISIEENIEMFKKHIENQPLLKKQPKNISRKFEIMILTLETFRGNFIGFTKNVFESFKDLEIIFFKEIYNYLTKKYKKELEQINYFEICLEN